MKAKEVRQQEAEARQKAYSALSLEEKLARLRVRGHEHCKEYKKLEEILQKEEK